MRPLVTVLTNMRISKRGCSADIVIAFNKMVCCLEDVYSGQSGEFCHFTTYFGYMNVCELWGATIIGVFSLYPVAL